ncbi:MAG: hypothetical protein IJQ28_06940 [Clostridia bacterium]|nr:hypothetical protein [Clostridia bacterium]
MEIKAELQKPFTVQERTEFIVHQNHQLGYEIRETETALQAWGYTEEEIEQQERERIAQLSLTKREVFLALYNDKGITPEQIKAQITDPSALIEFEYATEYFRGNPLIDAVGIMLGYTSEDLDYLFINKEFPNESDESNADDAAVSEEEA